MTRTFGLFRFASSHSAVTTAFGLASADAGAAPSPKVEIAASASAASAAIDLRLIPFVAIDIVFPLEVFAVHQPMCWQLRESKTPATSRVKQGSNN
jgi:hypothetical protein